MDKTLIYGDWIVIKKREWNDNVDFRAKFLAYDLYGKYVVYQNDKNSIDYTEIKNVSKA